MVLGANGFSLDALLWRSTEGGADPMAQDLDVSNVPPRSHRCSDRVRARAKCGDRCLKQVRIAGCNPLSFSMYFRLFHWKKKFEFWLVQPIWPISGQTTSVLWILMDSYECSCCKLRSGLVPWNCDDDLLRAPRHVRSMSQNWVSTHVSLLPIIYVLLLKW